MKLVRLAAMCAASLIATSAGRTAFGSVSSDRSPAMPTAARRACTEPNWLSSNQRHV